MAVPQNGAEQLYEVHRPDIADTYYGNADQVLMAELPPYLYGTPATSCYVFYQQDPNSQLPLTPLFRLSSFNIAQPGEHFLTANQEEHDSLMKEGWQDEGIACYVFSNNSPAGAVPWYRLRFR
jgi:hypothetical protein